MRYIWSNNIIDIEKKGNEYYFNCTFIVEKIFEPAILDLIDRKNSLGVIYGEFSEKDHSKSFDISLKRVSHILENIEIKYLLTYIEVKFDIRTINTQSGIELKELIYDGFPIVGKFRYTYDLHYIKVFTIDIDLEQNVIKESDQLKLERKMKIDMIEKRIIN